MKTRIAIALAAVVVAAGIGFNYIPRETPEVRAENAGVLKWCESIYHRNVTCPRYGQVEVPAAALAREETEQNAWCDRIYHQNVSCPRYGQVEVPAAVLARQEAEHRAWCESIDNRNVGCNKVN